MPVEVIMPKVDMDMAKGSLTAWLVDEGAEVREGDPLFEIETDKAAMEVESPGSGRLFNIVANPGDEVPVGTPVAWIYAESEAVGPPPTPVGAQIETESVTPEGSEPSIETAEKPAKTDNRVRATPLARRMAWEGGIDLAEVPGSGPRGRVRSDDVRRFTREARRKSDRKHADGSSRQAAVTEGQSAPVAVDGAGLILIHGLTADANAWAHLTPLLPADRAVVNLELPGHGRSQDAPRHSFDAMVDAVATRFDAIATPGVHLAAHSVGGAIAVALADRFPDRVASLTLIAPAGLGPEIDAAAIAGVARASRVESLTPWLKRFTADPDRISRNYASAAMMARKDEGLRQAQSEMVEALLPDAVQGFDITPILNRLGQPTRIIWGRADRIIPWSHALQAPGFVALNLLKDVGHLPHFEAPELVARLIDEQIAVAEKTRRD
ncbi:acetoin dehydrogenase dihydrolipoyllysine-residue acetyltransferase subunit [Bauldia sp.]|uniref:acetoin dehydrogenase dihydrolipoyllysine-residue acetyltransferase subunit n=1 Tax=Bauldia sp. TaxID=2575872 RepID=UPI003BAD96C7